MIEKHPVGQSSSITLHSKFKPTWFRWSGSVFTTCFHSRRLIEKLRKKSDHLSDSQIYAKDCFQIFSNQTHWVEWIEIERFMNR